MLRNKGPDTWVDGSLPSTTEFENFCDLNMDQIMRASSLDETVRQQQKLNQRQDEGMIVEVEKSAKKRKRVEQNCIKRRDTK